MRSQAQAESKDSFSRRLIARAIGWGEGVPDMNPDDIKFDAEARGFHKYIVFETGIVPVACYFKDHADRVEDRTLVVEVTAEALAAEDLRAPPAELNDPRSLDVRAQEMFPHRRERDVTVAEFERSLDDILHVAFEVRLVE